MRRLTRTLATPLALGGLLLLGACSADEAPTDDPTATQPATDDDDETAAPDDEEGDDEGDVTAGGAECLEGDWIADVEALSASLLDNPVFADTDAEMEVSGGVVVSFDGSVMTSDYSDNSVRMSMSLEGQEFLNETTINGTTTSDYTVDGDVLSVAAADYSEAEISTVTTINGEELDVPGMDAESLGADPGGDSTFECSADELRLTSLAEGGEDFVQVLTRK